MTLTADSYFASGTLHEQSRLKLELFKLKSIAPRKKRSGTHIVSYADVVWFLLEHYKKTQRVKEVK